MGCMQPTLHVRATPTSMLTMLSFVLVASHVAIGIYVVSNPVAVATDVSYCLIWRNIHTVDALATGRTEHKGDLSHWLASWCGERPYPASSPSGWLIGCMAGSMSPRRYGNRFCRA